MNPELLNIIDVQRVLVPELFDILVRRYEILSVIYSNQPIGRRKIASIIGVGEKIIRNEIAELKEHELVNILNQGMYISDEGIEVLKKAEKVIHIIKGHSDNEIQIAQKLAIKKVIISNVNSKDENLIMQETARIAARHIKTILKADSIVGVTGGATMAATARAMTGVNLKNKNLTVVPARGGLGVDSESQANNVAASFAEKLNCEYKLLHIAENLSKDLYESLKEHPEIKDVIECINNIDSFIFGIGRADVMAKRRNIDEKRIEEIVANGAVAEAFGYYFDMNGNIVEYTNTVGITFDNYRKMETIVGIASGANKVDAIISISKLNPNLVLVIDEELAKRVLEKIN